MNYTKIFVILSLSFITQKTHSQSKDKTGQIELMFSIPFVNTFYSKPEGIGSKSGIGFWGVSGAIGCQYAKNKFMSAIASSQIQYKIPVPMGIDYDSGILEDQYSSNISLLNNYEFKKLIFGYGLSYSWFVWRVTYFGEDYIPPNQISHSVSNQSIGLNFNTYYKIGKHFNIGIIYRPDFLMLNPTTKINYQHSISLDFCWRWRINTTAKNNSSPITGFALK